jgi:hypothetical protein
MRLRTHIATANEELITLVNEGYDTLMAVRTEYQRRKELTITKGTICKMHPGRERRNAKKSLSYCAFSVIGRLQYDDIDTYGRSS